MIRPAWLLAALMIALPLASAGPVTDEACNVAGNANKKAQSTTETRFDHAREADVPTEIAKGYRTVLDSAQQQGNATHATLGKSIVQHCSRLP